MLNYFKHRTLAEQVEIFASNHLFLPIKEVARQLQVWFPNQIVAIHQHGAKTTMSVGTVEVEIVPK